MSRRAGIPNLPGLPCSAHTAGLVHAIWEAVHPHAGAQGRGMQVRVLGDPVQIHAPVDDGSVGGSGHQCPQQMVMGTAEMSLKRDGKGLRTKDMCCDSTGHSQEEYVT